MAKRGRGSQPPAAARVVFEVEEGECVLSSKNERKEKHGDEDVLACDLEVLWETDNGVLACFAPALKSCLYEKPGVQGELVEDAEHLTHLRFASLGTLKWEGGALEGASVIFHGATGEKSDTKLEAVKVNKFRLDLKEGGTVGVHFRVQVSPLDEKLSGKLSKIFANGACTVSVVPPQPSEEVAKDLEAAGNKAGGESRPLVH